MSNTDEKLIRMVNQIASFFVTQPGDKAAASTAQHIRDFWDPAMIRQLDTLLDTTHDDLQPIALEAARQITNRTSA